MRYSKNSISAIAQLVPFLDPVVSHDPMATSITTRKQYVVESSSSTTKKVVIGDGEPQVEVRSFSTHDEQSSKTVNQKPIEEVSQLDSELINQIMVDQFLTEVFNFKIQGRRQESQKHISNSKKKVFL